jgi:uncharacterized protein YbjT (DUF2867 family)
MSGYTNFAVVGAGAIGKYIVQQLLKEKAAGIVKDVVVLTREVKYPYINRGMAQYSLVVDTKGSMTTVQGDAKVIHIDYSNHASIKQALAGVHVVISTVAGAALDVQGKIAAAGKEAGVELFVPSEFGGVTEGETEGWFGAKGNVQGQLKALGVPYALFYTGPFADYIWTSYVS